MLGRTGKRATRGQAVFGGKMQGGGADGGPVETNGSQLPESGAACRQPLWCLRWRSPSGIWISCSRSLHLENCQRFCAFVACTPISRIVHDEFWTGDLLSFSAQMSAMKTARKVVCSAVGKLILAHDGSFLNTFSSQWSF